MFPFGIVVTGSEQYKECFLKKPTFVSWKQKPIYFEIFITLYLFLTIRKNFHVLQAETALLISTVVHESFNF